MTGPIVSTRYNRQYGLVRQEIVENLNIRVVGDSEVLTHLLLNLAFCGVGSLQGGVYLSHHARTVEERHLFGQFLLTPQDVGEPFAAALADRLESIAPLFDVQEWPETGEESIIPDVTIVLDQEFGLYSSPSVVFADLGPASFHVGHRRVRFDGDHRSALTATLAACAGAVAAQDVLRLTNSIRAFAISDQSIQASLRIQTPQLKRYLSLPDDERRMADHGLIARFKLGGETIRVVDVEPTDEPDEATVTLEIPKESLVSRLILDSIDLVEEPLKKKGGAVPDIFLSPFGIDSIEDGRILSSRPLPSALEQLNCAILGVGGTGTWAAATLASTPSEAVHLTLVDCDTRVEEHNLNRQVLYGPDDIGHPKAEAAREALRAIRPDLSMHAYPLELTPVLALYIAHGEEEDYRSVSALTTEGSPDSQGVDIESRMTAMLSKDIRSAQAVLSCMDNMRARWALNVCASLAGTTFINGGALEFMGTSDVIRPSHDDASMVSRYGAGIKTDMKKVSCGGEIPLLSIVTTNALVGSLQSCFAVGVALGLDISDNYLYFNGCERMLFSRRIPEGERVDSLGIEPLLEELRDDFGIE